MSSGATVTETNLEIAGGASLRVTLPGGAERVAEAALPVVDVSNLPGARVPIRAGFQADHEALWVVCAAAPSRGWAPGVEPIVMARASQIARSALGGEVTRFEAGDIAAGSAGIAFEQRFQAEARRAGAPMEARGRHLLGFAGEAHEAVICSMVCVEPAGAGRCGGLVDRARAEGTWTGAPPPSLLVRAILGAAERPRAAGAIAGALLLALVALVIWRRPRPRAR